MLALIAVAVLGAESLDAWATSHLNAQGWERMGSGGNVVLYVRPDESRKPGAHTIWERYEYDVPDTYPDAYSNSLATRSVVSLSEYNCKGMVRTITTSTYHKNNMEDPGGTIERVSPWGHIIPGTMGEMVAQRVCQYMPTPEEVLSGYPARHHHKKKAASKAAPSH